MPFTDIWSTLAISSIVLITTLISRLGWETWEGGWFLVSFAFWSKVCCSFFLQLLLPLLLLLLLHNNLILDRAGEGWDWFLWFQVFAFFSAGTGKLLIWSFLFHHWLQTFGDSAHLCQVAFLAPYIDHLPQDGNKRRCARHIYSEMKSDPSSQRELIIMLDQTKRLHAK